MAHRDNSNNQRYALAILDSGNYALHLMSILEKNNLFCEFMSIPCPIAKNGCGYCIKFPIQYLDTIMSISEKQGLIIRRIYEIIPLFMKNKYKQIFPKNVV